MPLLSFLVLGGVEEGGVLGAGYEACEVADLRRGLSRNAPTTKPVARPVLQVPISSSTGPVAFAGVPCGYFGLDHLVYGTAVVLSTEESPGPKTRVKRPIANGRGGCRALDNPIPAAAEYGGRQGNKASSGGSLTCLPVLLSAFRGA